MDKRQSPITSKERLLEDEIDVSLRPVKFEEFTGQRKIVENLKIFIKAARGRGESLGSCILLTGPPGLGQKQRLAILLLAK